MVESNPFHSICVDDTVLDLVSQVRDVDVLMNVY
jgi:hypothetical protein